MKPKLFPTLLCVLLASALACDRIVEDAAPTPDSGSDEIAYYTLPNQQVAIDLKSALQVNAVTTVQLTQTPRLGQASFTKTGLLIYSPSPAFVAGEDKFAISTDQTVKTARQFRITVKADSSLTPCNAGALPEWRKTAEGQAITIDVLKNDRFCNASVELSSLSVAQLPNNGTARVTNGQITYTPKAGFNGIDYFFYKVSVAFPDRTRLFLASVRITVGEQPTECKLALNDESINWKPIFVSDSLLIPVLVNDQLCKSRPDIPITITQGPTNGRARILRGNIVSYTPTAGFTGNDQFMYSRCANGGCLEATAHITIPAPSADCFPGAHPDRITLEASQIPVNPLQRKVYLYVLTNDRICSPLRLVQIIDNPGKADLQVQSDGSIAYRPAAGFTGTIQFKYQLTDLYGKQTSAAVRVSVY